MLKMLLLQKGVTQIRLSEATNIHKNRIADLVHGRADPRPDEIILLDKALDQHRCMVLRHCSQTCPAGKYAGYQFSKMDMPTAGMQLVSIITAISRILPKIANMLCKGNLTPVVLGKLRQLRMIIMAIEVQAAPEIVSASYIMAVDDEKEKLPVLAHRQ